MPYVSPKDVARARADAAVADLASSMEQTSIASTETQSETEPNSESEATDTTDADADTDSLSRSHTPDAPSLLLCGTDSSNSVHTLSSVEDEFQVDVEVVEIEEDTYSPEMAQYHRDIIAFTKPLYDRAKMILERKMRVHRARGVVC
ncbi:hypothetical protein CcaverHIS002_0403840 [Cutaneotrichosporon cavernicola]|uniref:Uncharacterized protein n=1 Tax=Cutaneotrichosporon cavernicola TaxID=279322 RepID=A0AA48QVP4_9TREE|nr:uncharacterized protein CcaverHIS019_0403790 [Cutaneotrichosporon cavernicola]BEI83780.1 hypothetical protein CcaverHIS002_0403840 [Cutaneotrichosporon cavernicola]BEI91559.1 hypothetical protein CcaverHIS019_0403790 [Cutaneotrichosporon cavernicola]BEI99336.1 hypothetical protein CcaverHIS631_0403790 [Cutaneotrichosporon cavernicola]BEJ07111.1 hypothetical protein CcaverHIS641_0403800 [Cutaneotrichosporon cavernicola]